MAISQTIEEPDPVQNMISRRGFMKKACIGSTVAMLPVLATGQSGRPSGLPRIDYHVHLTEQFTIEKAVELSKKRQARFGIVEHPGSSIRNDDAGKFHYGLQMARECGLTRDDMFLLNGSDSIQG